MKRRSTPALQWTSLVLLGLVIGFLGFLVDGRKYFLEFSGERILLAWNLILSLLMGVGVVLFIRSFILLVANEFAYRRGRAEEHLFWNNVGGVVLTLVAMGGIGLSLDSEQLTVKTKSSQVPVERTQGRAYSEIAACRTVDDIKVGRARLETGRLYDPDLCRDLEIDQYNYVYDNNYLIFDEDNGVSEKLLPLGAALGSAIPLWLLIRAVRDILRGLAKLKPGSGTSASVG